MVVCLPDGVEMPSDINAYAWLQVSDNIRRSKVAITLC